ncbi:MAG: GNAT family N-acetyltransferase [Anaerolineae bacterium]|nr:GNAT family N-acetyltransferase [Anaerolineae bacterium]
MNIFETERLAVRHLETEDLDAFYAICGNAEVVRYMEDGKPLSRELTQKWIEVSQNNYRTKGYGCSAVIEKAAGDFIGFCGLVHTPGVEGQIEVIYAFKPSVWGRGYATEVVRAMLDYGRHTLNLPRIVATIHPDNIASIHVAEKAGMIYEKDEVDDAGIPTRFYAI